VRLEGSKYSPQLITATNAGSRYRGRPFCTIRDAFVDDLNTIIPGIDGRGNTQEWIGYAKDKSEWINIVKRKESQEHRSFEYETSSDESSEHKKPFSNSLDKD